MFRFIQTKIFVLFNWQRKIVAKQILRILGLFLSLKFHISCCCHVKIASTGFSVASKPKRKEHLWDLQKPRENLPFYVTLYLVILTEVLFGPKQIFGAKTSLRAREKTREKPVFKPFVIFETLLANSQRDFQACLWLDRWFW